MATYPFKLYSGQRFDDMVLSVKERGIIIPVIVRPEGENDYEILSGHNRIEAAKAAGLETVPSIIKEGLSDEEALLIVTETNLLQRSFADLTHSERAVTLSMHHEAIKKQGKRTDLIFEIESMVKASNIKDSETFSQVAKKLRTHETMAKEYGLSKDSIARYLRINKLITAFKEMLDNGELAFIPAVTLSYLTEQEQRLVNDTLTSNNYKIDMKKAEALRQLSDKRKLTEETAREVFEGKPIAKKSNRPAAIKIKPKTVSKYFTPSQKPDEIENTIVKALEFYFNHHQSQTAMEGDDIEDGEDICNEGGKTLESENDS